ncbi:MAG TPA: alpha-D-ribose 1-methylphosphonate 5-triphosphate diphosphatase [Paracoccus sp. (in: a-proteobacteria)]|uniref:alpha-D-ribose 1-methylphosphonate 5-triphosphate diphosphatase n=1 Tax=Paracoccus sp. TaxID=267 RepID=UPI002C56C8B9|nr:alpha-D-ribose 1-methylphosphonate 5-triphosphate diphosphatase [Paracoccus sp. (in: a-proteobacteria)]HWL55213.1 alpha-D-ribose 1-methylphosphonate 5-triphosphate diphosphatase [Paracoccus sp. (in: a-proteobacteria)]
MWISNFRVVLPDAVLESGALRIEDGMIAEILPHPVAGAAIDGRGMLLLPGFIDMHGDMIEREIEPRPQVRMPLELGLRDLDRKLAGCGITTAYAALSFSPSSTYGHLRSFEHTSSVIRGLKAMRGDLLVDHRVHARFEITFPNALGVIEALIRDAAVDLISLTDHTPGQGQYRDIERVIARTAREKNLSRDEAEASVARRIADRTRPAEELTATLAAISETCRRHGIAMASHDDDTVEKVALMAGLGVTISEFPVTLDAAAKARELGLATAMGAPNALRGESYSGNLSAREAHGQGALDILAADYHPSAMLPALLELARSDPAGLPGAARLCGANAALALGLHDRGAIEVGKRADLVIADPDGCGHVAATLRGGRVIYSDGRIAGAAADAALCVA